MARRVAIIGHPNTGKSFSRSFITNGENCFLISPSAKSTHMTTSTGEVVKELDIKIGSAEGWDAVASRLNMPTRHEVVSTFVSNGSIPENTELKGNYAIVPNMDYVTDYMLFIDKYMPHINTIFIGDFTHYIGNIIASPKFMNRTRGGEAFARFWDLAADALTNIILSTDKLTREIIVVTEYHAEYDDIEGVNKIFVPAGKMLSEKFKPESYYDYVLHTDVIDYDVESDDTKRFKFVITRKGRHDGRMAGLFPEAEDGMIPNDLQLVLDRIRKNEGYVV